LSLWPGCKELRADHRWSEMPNGMKYDNKEKGARNVCFVYRLFNRFQCFLTFVSFENCEERRDGLKFSEVIEPIYLEKL
jgi:hypothetical protein